MALNMLKVLSLDGGGMRGYLSLRWLQKFCQLAGIPDDQLWKYFNVISGTSIGGILALAIAYGMSLSSLLPFFTNDGKWIFTIRTAADVASGSINASTPSNRPSIAQKVIILGNNDQFYSSVDPNSNYGSAYFKKRLIDTFGTDTLQELKTSVLITSYKSDTKTPILFSNLNYPEFTGQNELISNVGLATAAAPLYFPPVPLQFNSITNTCIDGGVFCNNPAQIGLDTGKALKKAANRFCLLSAGTGLGEVSFDEIDNPNGPPSVTVPFEDAFKSLVGLINSSMTGAQEAVSRSLSINSQYTLDNLFYYRFQAPLDPIQDNELDNSDDSYLAYLDDLATQKFNENIDDVSNFIGHFTL